MSAEPVTSGPPRRRLNWWSVLLVVSLALNVFVIGAAAARLMFPPPPERFVGATYAQIVPRRFLSDLDRDRRHELLALLRQYRDDFSEGRLAARQITVALADALETEPYDAKKAEAAIGLYAETGNKLVSHGQRAALQFISVLTPEERKLMALHLRNRARLKGKR